MIVFSYSMIHTDVLKTTNSQERQLTYAYFEVY